MTLARLAAVLLASACALTGTAFGDGSGPPAELAEDEDLRSALALAYKHAPEWRRFADTAAARGTVVEWGPVEPGVGAMFWRLRNVVTVNERMRGKADTSLLAAVVAHEVYHASEGFGRTALSCLQAEVDAFGMEAYVWGSVPKPDRPPTAYEEWEGLLAMKARDGKLVEYVLLSEDYQRQCLGGVVREPEAFGDAGGTDADL